MPTPNGKKNTYPISNARALDAHTIEHEPSEPAHTKEYLDAVNVSTQITEQAEYDYVTTPPHYNRGGYGCYRVLEAIGMADNYNLATAFTYLFRAGHKPGNPMKQELEKAITHLQWEIERIEGGRGE